MVDATAKGKDDKVENLQHLAPPAQRLGVCWTCSDCGAHNATSKLHCRCGSRRDRQCTSLEGIVTRKRSLGKLLFFADLALVTDGSKMGMIVKPSDSGLPAAAVKAHNADVEVGDTVRVSGVLERSTMLLCYALVVKCKACSSDKGAHRATVAAAASDSAASFPQMSELNKVRRKQQTKHDTDQFQFLWSIRQNDTPTAIALLQDPALDVNKLSKQGSTPLMVAAQQGEPNYTSTV